MTQQRPWYLFPLTKSFNGASEKGVDLGVPYHTPVTPLFPGTVTAIDTGPYGQEVDVTGLLNGQRVTASYVHLDQATVMRGQQVGQNSTLGWSGGQLYGGMHPASPAYSSGPHIEFSLWPGSTTPYVGSPYNPMAFIKAVQSSGGGLVNDLGSGAGNLPTSATNASNTSASLLGSQGNQTSQTTQSSGGGGFNVINVNMPNYLNDILAGLHLNSLPDFVIRTVLIMVAIILMVIVANALSASAVRNTTVAVLNSNTGRAAQQVTGAVSGMAGGGAKPAAKAPAKAPAAKGK